MTQPTVRPLSGCDLRRVAAMFERLTPESRYHRFFSLAPSGPRWELAYLATIDGHDRLALIAEVDGVVVGIARYHRVGDGHAEMAVLVDDSWQHRGVGRRLVRALTVAAQGHGLIAFDVSVLGDNEAALRLVRGLAPTAPLRLDHGVFEVTIPIARPATPRTRMPAYVLVPSA